MDARPTPRPIHAAELIAVGTELTVGETTDTNSGELARSLVAHGVEVLRFSALPDDLDVVREAILGALARADLVVTTGGLGPTPDDLTREAVAEACGEALRVDPATLDWLHGLWARRGQPFPEANVKQAWTIPSATIVPNGNGTAPGWWVDRPDGRLIVTLPGPPRELRPMWADQVLPRLSARGVGADLEVRTLRLTGIGESQVVGRLGEPLLRAANPEVATYARHEAVDVRISARAGGGRPAAELADDAERAVLDAVGEHVWARGNVTWSQALGEALAARGWTMATVERGTAGAMVTLLGGLPAVLRSEVVEHAPGDDDLGEAERVRAAAGADVGLAIRVRARAEELLVHLAVVTPDGSHTERRVAFMRGSVGRERAALSVAAALLPLLRDGPGGRS